MHHSSYGQRQLDGVEGHQQGQAHRVGRLQEPAAGTGGRAAGVAALVSLAGTGL